MGELISNGFPLRVANDGAGLDEVQGLVFVQLQELCGGVDLLSFSRRVAAHLLGLFDILPEALASTVMASLMRDKNAERRYLRVRLFIHSRGSCPRLFGEICESL